VNKLSSTLMTLGLGAGLMYLYDPRSGNRRRALMRDQINQNINNTKDFWGAAMEDLRNRSRGITSQTKSMVKGEKISRTSNMDPEGNLTPGLRLLLAAGGAGLALYGRGRRGLIGNMLALAGLGMAARGVANVEYKRLFGLGMVKDAVDIRKAININASQEELYNFWMNFENFPKFMTHIKEIHKMDENRSHWVVEGPAGTSMEWDAVITERIPNHKISWESMGDSPVKSIGTVRFDPNNQGGTRVTVQMSYTPPAGAVGHVVATLLGKNPKQEMDDDMMRLKSLFEYGETTTRGQKIKRDTLTGAAGAPGD